MSGLGIQETKRLPEKYIPYYHLGKKKIYSVITRAESLGYAIYLHSWNPKHFDDSEWIIPYGPQDQIVGLVNYIEWLEFETKEEEAAAFRDLVERFRYGDDQDRELLHTQFQQYYDNRNISV